jgi:hypothetical protein
MNMAPPHRQCEQRQQQRLFLRNVFLMEMINSLGIWIPRLPNSRGEPDLDPVKPRQLYCDCFLDRTSLPRPSSPLSALRIVIFDPLPTGTIRDQWDDQSQPLEVKSQGTIR